MVKIELNDEDAELFKTFRRYQNIWDKIFRIENGQATLFFQKSELKQYEVSTFRKIKGEAT